MTRHTATTSTGLHRLLDRASSLIDGSPRPSPPRRERPADPTDALVEASWFMLQQLQIALGLTVCDVDVDRLVPDVLDRAAGFGIASTESVGAAASLVDHTRTGDPVALARTILAVRSTCGDVDLLAGVSSLMASLTVQIADGLALPPSVVHGELSERAATSVMGCSSDGGRARAVSARRQPCTRSSAPVATHRP